MISKRVKILHRSAEVPQGGWTEIAEVASLRDALDELESWQWLPLHHGDLVHLEGKKVDRLFVFDSARGSLVEAKRKIFKRVRLDGRSLFDLWEGADVGADIMLDACFGVDRRRLVLAACACAETALRFVPGGLDSPRIAIETARAWVFGKASIEAVEDAANESSWAFEDENQDAASEAVECAFIAALVAYSDDLYASEKYFSESASAALCAASAYEYAYGGGLEMPFEVTDIYEAKRKALGLMAPLVRRRIPLSVLACSIIGARDPIPFV